MLTMRLFFYNWFQTLSKPNHLNNWLYKQYYHVHALSLCKVPCAWTSGCVCKLKCYGTWFLGNTVLMLLIKMSWGSLPFILRCLYQDMLYFRQDLYLGVYLMSWRYVLYDFILHQHQAVYKASGVHLVRDIHLCIYTNTFKIFHYFNFQSLSLPSCLNLKHHNNHTYFQNATPGLSS